MIPACPLCSSQTSRHFHIDASREYFICPACDLVFVHPTFYLKREEEFKRYELHENSIDDLGYRLFLQRLCSPLLERIAPDSKGLDFGSGPEPLLKRMFEEQGHPVSLFDSFYAPEPQVFESSYDFISASEVVEHLHQPWIELDRLWSHLNPGGYLGIMTSMRIPGLKFPTWHYLSDRTHVIFFSPDTMNWLARRWEASLEVISESVVLFRKASTAPDRDSYSPQEGLLLS